MNVHLFRAARYLEQGNELKAVEQIMSAPARTTYRDVAKAVGKPESWVREAVRRRLKAG